MPDAPVMAAPEIPSMPELTMPRVAAPELPSLPPLELRAGAMPKLPALEVAAPAMPDAPVMAAPEIPSMPELEAPEVAIPQAPSFDRPDEARANGRGGNETRSGQTISIYGDIILQGVQNAEDFGEAMRRYLQGEISMMEGMA